MAMISFWLATLIVAAIDQAPADVEGLLDRRQQCAHWADEEPYDPARAGEIAAAVDRLRCSEVEADERRLRDRHRSNPEIIARLDADDAPSDRVTPFAPSRDAGFGDATPALSRLVRERGRGTQGVQHFCLIGYRYSHGSQVWAHWREANRLILWWGPGPEGAPDDSLVLSNRSLDLTMDVVATEAEVGGSTYLVTRAWVDATLADCASQGDHYAVSPS